jgi:hypothetical protein
MVCVVETESYSFLIWQIGPLLGDEEINIFQPTRIQQ